MPWTEHLVGYSVALTVASVVAFIAGLVAMRYAVIYMPADYFTRDRRDDGRWLGQHPAVRWSLFVLKNLIGVAFLALGLLMLVIPGPGVLMLLLGLSLVDVPGKRRAELWLFSFPAVHKKIDRLRIKHGQPPLKLPDRK